MDDTEISFDPKYDIPGAKCQECTGNFSKIIISKQKPKRHYKTEMDKKVKRLPNKNNKTSNQRPTFYIGKNNPCRAGGVLPYKMYDNTLYFIMIKSNGKYEDFGGKTSVEDKSINDTIIREAYEESNGIFSIISTQQNIENYQQKSLNIQRIYMKSGKYLLYIIRSDEDYDPDLFGNKEFHDNIGRTVEWVSIDTLMSREFTRTNLHPRLCNRYFFQCTHRFKT